MVSYVPHTVLQANCGLAAQLYKRGINFMLTERFAACLQNTVYNVSTEYLVCVSVPGQSGCPWSVGSAQSV